MKPARTLLPSVVITESTVLAACRDAASAECNWAVKAAIAGQMLIEYRETLKSSHRENSCTPVQWNDPAKKDGFKAWLGAQGIPVPTAYRWIAAADVVSRRILKISPADETFSGSIEIEGVVIPLSQALTAPEADLPAQALEFRQSWFDFMADKTLGEATRAALGGESPAHRITRAAAGMSTGGTKGEDRKDYPTFIAKKLSDISTHLEHWKGCSAPQREVIEEAFIHAIEKWPSPLLERVRKGIQAELTKR